MADSFFGFDTSLSNLNDDDGGGGDGSEDEYDALNDETFGHETDELDWEVEHEHLASQLESSRRVDHGIDDLANSQLEASLSQLVLDETDAPHSHTLGSSVWRHDPPLQPPLHQTMKNVCTVEEIERQLRQKQQQQQPFNNQNFFQPRFPVILQRPPGLQGPVPLPFAPQQPLNQMSQPLNKILGQKPQINQMPINQNVQQFMQSNQMGFQNNMMMQNMHQNQMMPQMNQMNLGQNMGQIAQNQIAQNMNQMGQNMSQIGQNQMGQNMNQMGQNVNQMGQNVNQMGQNVNQMGQNVNQMGQNMNQMGQNMNQMGQNVNQMGQNMNQMMPNGNQFGQMNQFQHMMGQSRMMAPPPGLNMPRQNFSPNMGQFNHNFRGPVPKPNDQQQQNMIINQQMIIKNQQMQQNHQNPMNQLQNQSMNQMGQNVNHIVQNVNPMAQNVNQMGQINQNVNPMGQNMNQMGQNMNQMGQNMNQMVQNVNQMGQMNQNVNQMNQNVNQIGQNMNQMNQLGQNVNQMNQNMGQNLSQSPQKGLKTDQKKSRVFNNKNQTMTSQNLVQLIQSTHPMLQFNNFHNANHHPMLNRNNQFNNLNHPMLNQRVNGVFNNGNNNNRSLVNGDDCGSDCDEYAGLMNQREKQWLINIQMLQLNTGTPYIHDFYYTVFLERQAKKEKEGVKEAHKVNQQNHPFYSGGVKQETMRRERHNSNRHNSTSEEPTPRTYVPAQFENSLGKLQCGSVTAPRKIIDVEVVGEQQQQQQQRTSRAPSVASTTNPHEVPRELKRTKQLLLDIEALYLILLRLEELNDPLAISNALILKEREEKQKLQEAAQKELEMNEQEDESNLFLKNIESVQRRPKQDSPKSETIDKRQVVNLAVSQKPAPVKNLLDEDKDELVNKMFMGLLAGDRLAQMLTVRKGRTLVSRFLSRSGSHPRLRGVWWRVFRALPSLARRTDDGTLAHLAPHYARYIENTTSWSPVLETCSLLSEALDPARTPYALTTSFTLTCVCALIEKATLLITSTTDTTSNERQWSKFLKTLTRALKNTSLNVARPLKPMSEQKLNYHLKQIESRSTIEILQRGKPAEFADLSKTDVSDQLMKHLC